jgi:hypothetical protein
VLRVGGNGVFQRHISSSSSSDIDVMLEMDVVGALKIVESILVKKCSCETAWCPDMVGARHCDVALML